MKRTLFRTFKRLYISMLRSQQRRATEHVLMQLSKRELDDIGISRSDIPYIVRNKRRS